MKITLMFVFLGLFSAFTFVGDGKTGDSDKAVDNLRDYFGRKNFFVIGDKLSVVLDGKVYPLNNDKFIVFYYKINGEQVSKKIGFDNGKLVLEKKKLLHSGENVHKSDTITDVQVYQYEISTKHSEYITKFNLCFIAKDELVEKLTTAKGFVQDQGLEPKEIKEYLWEFFGDEFGKTDGTVLDKIINTIVG